MERSDVHRVTFIMLLGEWTVGHVKDARVMAIYRGYGYDVSGQAVG